MIYNVISILLKISKVLAGPMNEIAELQMILRLILSYKINVGNP